MKNIISQFYLTNKVALVTGSSQGIGLQLARAYGQAGASVILNGRSVPKLEQAAKSLQSEGIKVHIAPFDVCNEEEVDSGITEIEKSLGRIDILVNNAGTIIRKPIVDTSLSEFRTILETDLLSVLTVSKRVVRKMIEGQSGKIINICSMMSEYGRNRVSAYASAKGGLKMLTKNMCVEWAKYNIQVNGLGPGYIETALTKDLMKEDNPFNKLVMSRTPAARWGKVEDLCGAALLLASEAGSFINGQIIYVDGGILANFGYMEDENK